jgi:hypothetical protein
MELAKHLGRLVREEENPVAAQPIPGAGKDRARLGADGNDPESGRSRCAGLIPIPLNEGEE